MDRFLGESDWDDLDLITTEEASYRFDAEIAELRKFIEGEGSASDAEALTAARARLALLLDARDRLSRPRTLPQPPVDKRAE